VFDDGDQAVLRKRVHRLKITWSAGMIRHGDLDVEPSRTKRLEVCGKLGLSHRTDTAEGEVKDFVLAPDRPTRCAHSPRRPRAASILTSDGRDRARMDGRSIAAAARRSCG